MITSTSLMRILQSRGLLRLQTATMSSHSRDHGEELLVDASAPIERERLSKMIAQSGLGSRRDAELWIKGGRVSVNGKVIKSPAFKVTALSDCVLVDGIPVANFSHSAMVAEKRGVFAEGERPRIWAVHKVRGELVGNLHDRTKGRPLLIDRVRRFLRGYNHENLKPVDRIDFNVEGLVLLTNNASLSRYLGSDGAALTRTYRVRVHGLMNESKIRAMLRSISDKDGVRSKPFSAATLDRQGQTISWITMTSREHRNRAINLMLEKLALRPVRIICTDLGPFSLGDMPAGAIKEIRLIPAIIQGWRKSM